MALSYRTVVDTHLPEGVSIVRETLQASYADREPAAWFGSDDSLGFRLLDPSSAGVLIVVAAASGTGASIAIERRHPLAVGEVEIDDVPECVPPILGAVGALAGNLSLYCEPQALDLEEWLQAGEREGEAVLEVTQVPAEQGTKIQAELRRQLLGMATIGRIPLAVGEQILRRAHRPGNINPGALIHIARWGELTEVSVTPATVVRQRCASAVRRHRRRCLAHQARRTLPASLESVYSEVVDGGKGLHGFDQEWFTEFEQLERTIEELRAAQEIAWLEQDEATRELQRTRARLAYTQTRLREFEFAPIFEIPSELDEVEPDTCHDAVRVGQDLLSRVVIKFGVDLVLQLDEYEKSLVWAGKIWSALRALESFAVCRTEHGFKGSFLHFCDDPPIGGVGYFPSSIAMKESESTDRHPVTRQARTFPVPETVAPDGWAYMPAHIKIDRGRHPAPRIHFLDDTANTGRIYVGYIGPHLPTGSEN